MSARPGRSRVRAPRPVVAVAALLVVLAGGALVGVVRTASAAQLAVDGGALTATTVTHPCPGTAAATAATVSGSSASGVAVIVPDGCATRTLDVTVLSGSTVVASGSTPVTSGTTTVPVGAYTPTASMTVLAVVDGWDLPVTWSYTPPATGPVSCRVPADSSVTCTATMGSGSQWGWPTVTTFNRFVQVTTSSAKPVVWEVTFHLDDPAWPVRASRLTDTQGGLVLVSASACGSSPRTVTVRGTTSWGQYDQVRSGVTRTMQVEGSSIGGTGNLLSCP